MLMTPLACLGLDAIAGRMKARGGDSPAIESFEEAMPTVLVIGFGRFGMMVAQILTSEGLEITAIDNRPDRIAYARKLGYKVYYGDATRADVLAAAGAGKAALIAMCIENDRVMGKSIELLRSVDGSLTVGDSVDMLARLVDQDDKYDGISVRPPGEMPVQVMNLHQCKGLEAPFVFLVDPSGESTHDVDVHIDRSAD